MRFFILKRLRPTGLSFLFLGNPMILKEKIIHESLKLFSLKGFTSTSIQDILAAANTSKGGFYNHFSSKEDLFYKRKMEQLGSQVRIFGFIDIFELKGLWN